MSPSPRPTSASRETRLSDPHVSSSPADASSTDLSASLAVTAAAASTAGSCQNVFTAAK